MTRKGTTDTACSLHQGRRHSIKKPMSRPRHLQNPPLALEEVDGPWRSKEANERPGPEHWDLTFPNTSQG